MLIIGCRTGEQILSEMVTYCVRRQGSRKTWIMYACNLSYEQLVGYLSMTEEGNYLDLNEEGFYIPTGKGELLHRSNALIFRLSITGRERDPYNSSKLRKKVKAVVSSLKSVKIPRSGRMHILKRKRRVRHDIIGGILNNCIPGRAKTQVMYQNNLSFAQVNKYLDDLKKTNLLEVGKAELQKKERKIYITTDKGRLFVETYKLQSRLLITGGDEDPFTDPELTEKIETALSPMLSFEIPEDAYAIPFEELEEELSRQNRDELLDLLKSL